MIIRLTPIIINPKKRNNMKRALLTGCAGSGYLYFLRFMESKDDPHFDARVSQDFHNILFYGADAFPEKNDEYTLILDATGEKLKHMGTGLYYAAKLASPEIPLEMGTKQESNEPSTSNKPITADNS